MTVEASKILAKAGCAVLCGIICVAAYGLPSRQSTLKDEIQRRDNEFSKAIAARDKKFFESYFSKDAVVLLPTHETRSRQDILNGLSDLLSKTQRLRWTLKVLDLHVASDGVVARVQGHLSGRALGDDKKPHSFLLDGVNNDTWILEDNAWVVKKVEIVSLAATVDGKKIPAPSGLLGTPKP